MLLRSIAMAVEQIGVGKGRHREIGIVLVIMRLRFPPRHSPIRAGDGPDDVHIYMSDMDTMISTSD